MFAQLGQALASTGPITDVRVNGDKWKAFDARSVSLSYEKTPETARVQILLGGAQPQRESKVRSAASFPILQVKNGDEPPELSALNKRAARLRDFCDRLTKAGLGESYEAAHARLAWQCIATSYVRRKLQREGRLNPLPAASQVAADKSYIDTAVKLCDGLEKVLNDSRKTTRSVCSRADSFNGTAGSPSYLCSRTGSTSA